ncbi:hypothetical protein AwPolaro_05550 [Polaromonas sp.]|nr:hypothetical protein AwPolaro_05550 [Polaromonas sp.]
MFERPHHQRIDKLLHSFNSELLQEAECFFGGGTAIVVSAPQTPALKDVLTEQSEAGNLTHCPQRRQWGKGSYTANLA